MSDIDNLDIEAAADLLRALAHGIRLTLLRALVSGERSVGEIEATTGIIQPGLSQQLAILRKADLVEARRKAKQVFYRINQSRLEEVSALLGAFASTLATVHDDPIQTQFRAGGGAAMFARIIDSPQVSK